MRQALSVILTLAMLPRFASAAPDSGTVTTQITALPEGAHIDLRLKSKEKLHGTRGALSDTGFTLISAPAADRQIAFDDVATVKLHKSHTTRNVVIIVGVGIIVAVGITAGVLFRCGGSGTVRNSEGPEFLPLLLERYSFAVASVPLNETNFHPASEVFATLHSSQSYGSSFRSRRRD